MIRAMRRRSCLAVLAIGVVVGFSPLHAQWLKHPTAGVPQTPDGKPNLSAPAPRTADGKPDFSGLWENDGFDPNRAEGLNAGGPPKTPFFEIVHGMTGAPPYQPWAADLTAKRKADFGKDIPTRAASPLVRCRRGSPAPEEDHPGAGTPRDSSRNMEFRQIFTDGRASADQQPSWSGYSWGHGMAIRWWSDLGPSRRPVGRFRG